MSTMSISINSQPTSCFSQKTSLESHFPSISKGNSHQFPPTMSQKTSLHEKMFSIHSHIISHLISHQFPRNFHKKALKKHVKKKQFPSKFLPENFPCETKVFWNPISHIISHQFPRVIPISFPSHSHIHLRRGFALQFPRFFGILFPISCHRKLPISIFAEVLHSRLPGGFDVNLPG